MTREAGASDAKIPVLKKLLVQAAAQVETERQMQGQTGVLIDGGDYGRDALASATGRGWWVGRPVELPGSRPLRFDGIRSIGSALTHWPTEQVVKCLLHYHPDDHYALRLEQEQKVLELWEATRASGNELLLEIILPKALSVPGQEDAAVLRAVKRFYNIGVKPEWWKLAPMTAAGWHGLELLVAERDPHCRGAVILGLNQPIPHLVESFRNATNPIVKGFMVGRSLWMDESLAWLRETIDDATLVSRVAANYTVLVDAWRNRRSLAHVVA
jgi:5-dehydro-2-deoxygluconokinase